MSSINNTNPVRTHMFEQSINMEPTFSHGAMPDAKPSSNSSIERMSEQSPSIPLSTPVFRDSYRTQDEEPFTLATAVFFEDDLELPNAMPTILETVLPETLPSVSSELEKDFNPIFKKTEDVAQYSQGDWSGYIGKSHTKNEQEAYEIARKDKRIEFFFRVKDGARLVLEQGNTLRVFHSGEAAFFSGKPKWGSAENYADGYVVVR